MKQRLRLALIGAALPLAGCMTSGTNMHGSFACRAPTGTCAPMSTIDASAVAGLGAGMQPVGGIVDPALPREGRVVTASVDGSPPGRTSDRVLRVVFPAHIDASGIYHDESTAHAVVEHGGWTDGLTGGARRAALDTVANTQAGNRASLQADQPRKLASLDELIAARAAQSRLTGASDALSAPIAPVAPAAVAPGAPVPVVQPIALRSPIALQLREAAAAISAQPVAGLDPNFDTPDVSAALVAEPAAVEHCTGYRPVWWLGHAYRRLRPVPCLTVTATAAVMSPAAVTPRSTLSLNLAHLEHPTTLPVTAAPVPAVMTAAATRASAPSSPAPAQPVRVGASPSPAVTGATAAPGAISLAPTSDPAVAAARVSAPAAPVIADQVRLGRAAAKAATSPIGDLLAGAKIVPSASEAARP